MKQRSVCYSPETFAHRHASALAPSSRTPIGSSQLHFRSRLSYSLPRPATHASLAHAHPCTGCSKDDAQPRADLPGVAPRILRKIWVAFASSAVDTGPRLARRQSRCSRNSLRTRKKSSRSVSETAGGLRGVAGGEGFSLASGSAQSSDSSDGEGWICTSAGSGRLGAGEMGTGSGWRDAAIAEEMSDLTSSRTGGSTSPSPRWGQGWGEGEG